MYAQDQDSNRLKALNHANEWLDCMMAAEPFYRNKIRDDLLQLLFIKAENDEEMNNKLKQVMTMIENMRQIYEVVKR